MCGEDNGEQRSEDWDGWVDGEIVPPEGPIPATWPSSEDLGKLLRSAASRWDSAGLFPPSSNGILLPPGYGEVNETAEQGLERLTKDWRLALRDFTFRNQLYLASTAAEDLGAFLETGKSGADGSRTVKLMVLFLKPSQIFGLHAHPTIELELTLRGALGEVRLVGVNDPLKIPFHGPWPERVCGKSLVGPNLTNLTGPYAHLVESAHWKHTEPVSPGKYLFNEIGSIHKSYTVDDSPFAALILWGGIHATIDEADQGTLIPNSELLNMT